MKIKVTSSSQNCGFHAALRTSELIREATQVHNEVNLVVATGASQFSFYHKICQIPKMPWEKINIFHLDEYIGIAQTHPASFRHYLKNRFLQYVPYRKFYPIRADFNPISKEITRISNLIQKHPIHVACIGIGENGHIAFNDPPANFTTHQPYIKVKLDKACRAQQLHEGWFPTLEAVPTHAISMSVHQILQAQSIICTVPEIRKAQAVRDCLSPHAQVNPMHPASILKTHSHTECFLDSESAKFLEESVIDTRLD